MLEPISTLASFAPFSNSVDLNSGSVLVLIGILEIIGDGNDRGDARQDRGDFPGLVAGLYGGAELLDLPLKLRDVGDGTSECLAVAPRVLLVVARVSPSPGPPLCG